MPSWTRDANGKLIKSEESSNSISNPKNIWDIANEPLIKPTPIFNKARKEFAEKHPVIGGVGNFFTDLLSESTSPLQAGLTLASGGAAAAGKLGLASRGVLKGAAGGMVGHGGYKIATGDSLAERGAGLAEVGLGALGLRHAYKTPEFNIDIPTNKSYTSNRPFPLEDERGFITLGKSNSSTSPASGRPGKATIPQTESRGTANLKNVNYRPIPDEATPKEAIGQWATGAKSGAEFRSNNIKNDFSDLTDESLIDKFQSGDRTGRLSAVQNYFDTRHEQAVLAGLLKPDQKKLNYLRQYWQQGPEEVSEAVKKFVSKEPQFAKESKIPTYAKGKEYNLTPKYSTLPEIIGAYENEFNRGLRNKELYDHLLKTKQIKPGEFVKSPDNWTFIGPNSKELTSLVSNVMGSSPGVINKLANASSWSKNLYFGAGIPKTPLNMHMYNITRSNIRARGVKAGLGDFMSGVFNPEGDLATIRNNRSTVEELVDHGMGMNIEEHKLFGEGEKLLGKALGKITDFQQKMFEDPLFKIHLPAVKIRMATERLNELLKKGISREQALTQAAVESNDFYGGINKVLRNKTYNDLSRMGLLAPDWLESRINLGIKGVKALAGREDPLYAKSTARAAGMLGAGLGAGAIAYGGLNPSKRPSNATSIHLGKTGSGKNREFPILGTAAEDIRLPIELGSSAKSGNWEDFSRVLSNRMSRPLQSGLNILLNKDEFGSPLVGHDRYGRPIKGTKAIKNISRQFGQVITPPWTMALYQLLTGQDPEIAISQGLELPVKYNTEPKDKRRGLELGDMKGLR